MLCCHFSPYSQAVNCSRQPEMCTAVICNISDFSPTSISILVLSYVDNRFFRVSFQISSPFSPNFSFVTSKIYLSLFFPTLYVDAKWKL